MERPHQVATAHLRSVLAAGALVALGTAAVSAQDQATATMLVTATVARKCVMHTTPMNFGTYDPLNLNATAPLDAQSTITVACTKGTTVSISIDDGRHDRFRTRRMDGGLVAFLEYDLYKDRNRTERWGDRRGETYDGGVAPSRDPRTFIVYGRVPGGQDARPGEFQDTVVVTVDF